MTNPVPLLRKVALAEAVSFLVLLGIAMPLKYLWAMPRAVLLVGSIHGALFVLFCAALARVWFRARWPLPRLAAVFVASLIPIAPFLIDRRMQAWVAEWRPAGA